MSDRELRVLVVDDSAINRKSLSGLLEKHPGVRVVGAASDGDEALRLVASLSPDLITLDLEMPRMDGFTFLRLLMASRPTPVIVVSSHSAKENVFRALELGAIDFIAKPDQLLAGRTEEIRAQLDHMVAVVRQLAPSNWQKRKINVPSEPPRKVAAPIPSPASSATASVRQAAPLPVSSHLRPPLPDKVVVIASSTGGPTALLELFSRLPSRASASIVVAQHMPDRFTKAFADRLDRLSSFRVSEAEDQHDIQPGMALVCPGGRCIELRRSPSRLSAHVVWPDKEDRYAPSADRLFTTAASAAGSRVIGVVLTGMGDDGARGVLDIHSAGGAILAESEETAVVFGMPKAAARTGKVNEVLPLGGLVDRLVKMLA